MKAPKLETMRLGGLIGTDLTSGVRRARGAKKLARIVWDGERSGWLDTGRDGKSYWKRWDGRGL